ncbi:hypothetical protein [Methyloceanibacter superfactus]|uniref:hypothetical protein n=1 Tax=Methyloceanibacter superfactus TaxID=1774969 RepID=UPI0013012FB2|nr:hypothetical protein [Methyloceanibacter superfactus]
MPVTFKAKVTEVGPKLQGGITWRVYNSRPAADGSYELVSTHREPSPTAALLPGEYLVNAAYGLSNLTKKIKVEGGKSIEETFVLNTGGSPCARCWPTASPAPRAASASTLCPTRRTSSATGPRSSPTPSLNPSSGSTQAPITSPVS